jgi:hypothetical protein
MMDHAQQRQNTSNNQPATQGVDFLRWHHCEVNTLITNCAQKSTDVCSNATDELGTSNRQVIKHHPNAVAESHASIWNHVCHHKSGLETSKTV